MRTVRLLHGEFKSQVPAAPEEKPDFAIGNISEVRELPFLWGDIETHHGGTKKRRQRK